MANSQQEKDDISEPFKNLSIGKSDEVEKPHEKTDVEKLLGDIDSDWKEFLNDEIEEDYFNELARKVAAERGDEMKRVCPRHNEVFNWTNGCKPEDVRVVMVGEDPGRDDKAHGYAFSNRPFSDRSFSNGSSSKEKLFFATTDKFFKDLVQDDNIDPKFDSGKQRDGNLEGWAQQGVLLLNVALTGAKPKFDSWEKHYGNAKWGNNWKRFTDRVVERLEEEYKENKIYYILWGDEAKEMKEGPLQDAHDRIAEYYHPSAEGYAKTEKIRQKQTIIGKRAFSNANYYLIKILGQEPIDWNRTQKE